MNLGFKIVDVHCRGGYCEETRGQLFYKVDMNQYQLDQEHTDFIDSFLVLSDFNIVVWLFIEYMKEERK